MKSFKRVGVQMLSEATKVKRLTRSKALLKRVTAAKCRRVFFTDEKVFYIDPPLNSQNNRLRSSGRKKDIDPRRLLQQRAKFSQRFLKSMGMLTKTPITRPSIN